MSKSNLSKNASSARTGGTAAARDARTTPATAGSAAQAGFSTDDVERAADLGGGYVIIKLADARLRAWNAANAATVPKVNRALDSDAIALLGLSTPAITLAKIKSLLERYADRTVPASAVRPGKSDRANAAFSAALTSQGMASRQRHLDEGRLLTSSDLCERRAISRQALSKAVKDQRMFMLEGPSNTQLYPAFFATDIRRLRLLESVSRMLGAMPGPSKWEFFVTPKTSLGGLDPVAVIDSTGDDPTASAASMKRVMDAARAFKERVLGA